MAISILIEFGVVTRAIVVFDDSDKLAIGRNLQDFLICFEMMVTAISGGHASLTPDLLTAGCVGTLVRVQSRAVR